MTDDLVKRLRSNRPIPTLPHEAADRIEALTAKVERLREALEPLANKGRLHLDALDVEKARAALEKQP